MSLIHVERIHDNIMLEYVLLSTWTRYRISTVLMKSDSRMIRPSLASSRQFQLHDGATLQLSELNRNLGPDETGVSFVDTRKS